MPLYEALAAACFSLRGALEIRMHFRVHCAFPRVVRRAINAFNRCAWQFVPKFRMFDFMKRIANWQNKRHTKLWIGGVGGFTLIEVLVAMAVMAILALMSWRGIEAMLEVQAVSEKRSREIAVVQTGLSQWMSDLNHVQTTGLTSQLFYDGKVFLITREDLADEQRRLRAVVWALRTGSDGETWWVRWQSKPFSTRGGLSESMKNARKWFATSAGAADAQREQGDYDVVRVFPVNGVELKAFDASNADNQWVSLQGANLLPPGIRLEVDLAGDWSVQGKVVRDWVRPTYTRRRDISTATSTSTSGGSSIN